MDLELIAVLAGGVVLALLIGLQLTLAAGLPFGALAWGGGHRVLPSKLRMGSALAALILAAAAWVLLARAGSVPPGATSAPVRILAWVFAGYFALNAFANLRSRSVAERAVMTFVASLLAVCFAVVARS